MELNEILNQITDLTNQIDAEFELLNKLWLDSNLCFDHFYKEFNQSNVSFGLHLEQMKIYLSNFQQITNPSDFIRSLIFILKTKIEKIEEQIKLLKDGKQRRIQRHRTPMIHWNDDNNDDSEVKTISKPKSKKSFQ